MSGFPETAPFCLPLSLHISLAFVLGNIDTEGENSCFPKNQALSVYQINVLFMNCPD